MSCSGILCRVCESVDTLGEDGKCRECGIRIADNQVFVHRSGLSERDCKHHQNHLNPNKNGIPQANPKNGITQNHKKDMSKDDEADGRKTGASDQVHERLETQSLITESFSLPLVPLEVADRSNSKDGLRWKCTARMQRGVMTPGMRSGQVTLACMVVKSSCVAHHMNVDK